MYRQIGIAYNRPLQTQLTELSIECLSRHGDSAINDNALYTWLPKPELPTQFLFSHSCFFNYFFGIFNRNFSLWLFLNWLRVGNCHRRKPQDYQNEKNYREAVSLHCFTPLRILFIKLGGGAPRFFLAQLTACVRL